MTLSHKTRPLLDKLDQISAVLALGKNCVPGASARTIYRLRNKHEIPQESKLRQIANASNKELGHRGKTSQLQVSEEEILALAAGEWRALNQIEEITNAGDCASISSLSVNPVSLDILYEALLAPQKPSSSLNDYLANTIRLVSRKQLIELVDAAAALLAQPTASSSVELNHRWRFLLMHLLPRAMQLSFHSAMESILESSCILTERQIEWNQDKQTILRNLTELEVHCLNLQMFHFLPRILHRRGLVYHTLRAAKLAVGTLETAASVDTERNVSAILADMAFALAYSGDHDAAARVANQSEQRANSFNDPNQQKTAYLAQACAKLFGNDVDAALLPIERFDMLQSAERQRKPMWDCVRDSYCGLATWKSGEEKLARRILEAARQRAINHAFTSMIHTFESVLAEEHVEDALAKICY